MQATSLSLLAVVVVCGSALAGEPLTRKEYVSRAEAVCKVSKEVTEPLLNGIGSDIKHDRLDAAGHALSTAAQRFEAQRRRLLPIPKPPNDAKVLTVWLNRLKTQSSLMATAGRLMQEDRRSKVTGYLARYAHEGNLANDTVLGFGFDACLFRLSRLPNPPKR